MWITDDYSTLNQSSRGPPITDSQKRQAAHPPVAFVNHNSQLLGAAPSAGGPSWNQLGSSLGVTQTRLPPTQQGALALAGVKDSESKKGGLIETGCGMMWVALAGSCRNLGEKQRAEAFCSPCHRIFGMSCPRGWVVGEEWETTLEAFYLHLERQRFLCC